MNLNRKIAQIAATCGLVTLLAVPAVGLAQPLSEEDLGVTAVGETVKLGGGDIRETAARIINVALGFLGIIAVVIVLMGGFKYMVAGGNEEKTAAARKWIVSGIIGLAIILSAWAITQFVIGRLLEATREV